LEKRDGRSGARLHIIDGEASKYTTRKKRGGGRGRWRYAQRSATKTMTQKDHSEGKQLGKGRRSRAGGKGPTNPDGVKDASPSFALGDRKLETTR